MTVLQYIVEIEAKSIPPTWSLEYYSIIVFAVLLSPNY